MSPIKCSACGAEACEGEVVSLDPSVVARRLVKCRGKAAEDSQYGEYRFTTLRKNGWQ